MRTFSHPSPPTFLPKIRWNDSMQDGIFNDDGDTYPHQKLPIMPSNSSNT